MSAKLTRWQLYLLRQIALCPVLPSARIKKRLDVLLAAGYVWRVDGVFVTYDITDAGRQALDAGGEGEGQDG